MYFFAGLRGIDATKGRKNSLERRNIHLEEGSWRNRSEVTLDILQMLLCSSSPSQSASPSSILHVLYTGWSPYTNLRKGTQFKLLKQTIVVNLTHISLPSASRRGFGNVMASSVWTLSPGREESNELRCCTAPSRNPLAWAHCSQVWSFG